MPPRSACHDVETNPPNNSLRSRTTANTNPVGGGGSQTQCQSSTAHSLTAIAPRDIYTLHSTTSVSHNNDSTPLTAHKRTRATHHPLTRHDYMICMYSNICFCVGGHLWPLGVGALLGPSTRLRDEKRPRTHNNCTTRDSVGITTHSKRDGSRMRQSVWMWWLVDTRGTRPRRGRHATGRVHTQKPSSCVGNASSKQPLAYGGHVYKR